MFDLDCALTFKRARVNDNFVKDVDLFLQNVHRNKIEFWVIEETTKHQALYYFPYVDMHCLKSTVPIRYWYWLSNIYENRSKEVAVELLFLIYTVRCRHDHNLMAVAIDTSESSSRTEKCTVQVFNLRYTYQVHWR